MVVQKKKVPGMAVEGAEEMKALKMDKCEMSKCYGDDSQFCGGPEGYAFYVAECPTGLKRFGDHCYDIDTATPGEIDDNADICSKNVRQTIVWVLLSTYSISICTLENVPLVA